MRKKLAAAIALALVAAVAVPAFASAATPGPASAASVPVQGSLAIVAPRAAAVGATVQMTVFKASDQTTVAGAHVWAVSPDKLRAVTQQLNRLAGQPQEQADAAADQAIDVIAVPLGRTDQNGILTHQFQEAGRRLLVAFKAGFFPDARPIAIGTGAGPARLTIHAPARAAVSEKIDITVVDAVKQQGIKDARVWALTKAQAEALKGRLVAGPGQSANETATASIESQLNVQGTFLGTTNGAGKLEPQPSFANAGAYVLVAIKAGYRPTIKGILVGAPVAKGLVIQAPARAHVNDKVGIRVVDKATQNGAKDAGVWALTLVQAQSLKSQLSAGSTGTDNNSQLEAALKARGLFLGTTNGDGKIEPQPSFNTAGRYVLVAFKPGNGAGLKGIVIVNPQPDAGKSRPSTTK
jgi:hypothetical protein